jgi:hypothetical protein
VLAIASRRFDAALGRNVSFWHEPEVLVSTADLREEELLAELNELTCTMGVTTKVAGIPKIIHEAF